MRKFSFSEIANLPETAGVFCFLNETNKTVFTGVAENLNQEISRLLIEKDLFRSEIKQIEIKLSDEKNLISLFAGIVRERKPIYNFDLSEQRHFPHFKITNEKFPRLLVTRKIENDGAEYFGAFLPETGVRLLLDFLNRIFRWRSCTVNINGDFPVPCTMFYEKRCVAPCVASLCDKQGYDEIINLIKLFLRDEREEFLRVLYQKINFAAAKLDFETAGGYRDILQSAEAFWEKKESQFRLEPAVDSFEVIEKEGKIFVYLVSQRGRKILGRRAFVINRKDVFSAQDALSQVVWQMYEFYTPKEIRVSTDFSSRQLLTKVLSLREERKLKTFAVNENNQKITTERALTRTKFEFDFRRIEAPKSFAEIQDEFKVELGLKQTVKRIEAFDVAHISGTGFVAGKSVWESGKFLVNEYEFWFLDEKSELKALEKGIAQRFRDEKKLPDLILIDGGKSQLNAALKAVENLSDRQFSIIAAVKPRKKHAEISHFITESSSIIKMKTESKVFQMLVHLRDEAHRFANSVHRRRRDTAHFYETAALLPSINEKDRRFLLQKYGSLKKIKSANTEDFVQYVGFGKAREICKDLLKKDKGQKIEPLIVPIRFDEESGDARDLQPISNTRI